MQELRARCPKCMSWFVVENPELDAHFLCPTCLTPADWTRWHDIGRLDDGEGAGGA